MKTREEMIAALQAQDSERGPSREQMIAALNEQDAQSGSLPEPKRHSEAVSAFNAGLQGAAGGFLDEYSGAAEAAGRAVGVKGLGGRMADMELAKPNFEFSKNYTEARDKTRERLAEQGKEYPVSTTIAGLAGSVASPINKVGKGVSLAKGAATIGGINALGNSEADNAKDLLVDTAIGTGAGLILGKVTEKVAGKLDKAVQKVGEKSREGAKWLAARAIGAERNTIKSQGAARVKDAGAQALDEGVLSAWANTDDLIARNKAVKKAGGELMDEAYSAIDDKAASTFNPLEVAAKVDDKLSPDFRTAINKGETSQLENTLESILARGEKNIPLKEAQKLKKEIGAVAFPKGKKPIDPTPKQQMAMDAYDIINKSIDDAAQAGSKIVEEAGLAETLAKGKKLYGNARTSDRLLENKLAREQGNRLVGLTDIIMGGSALGYGGTTGDWKTAAGLVAGKKYLEKYGAQQAALTLNKLSKNLLAAPAMVNVAKKSPPLFVSIAQKIERNVSGAAAENEELSPELKGEDKWVSEGFSKLMENTPAFEASADQVANLVSSKKGRALLMQASDLKPGTKAMENVIAKIKTQLAEGK